MSDMLSKLETETPLGLRPDTDIPKWVWIAPAIAVLVAILPLPYFYYIVLRWGVCGAAAFIAWKEFDLNKPSPNLCVWIFGVLAILYNPIIPVHSVKVFWVFVNLATAGAFYWHYKLRLRLTK
jgi:hypothetical protein